MGKKLYSNGLLEPINYEKVCTNFLSLNNILYGIKAGNTILNLIKADTENHKGFNINYNIKVNKNDQNIKLDNINDNNILYVNSNIGID